MRRPWQSPGRPAVQVGLSAVSIAAVFGAPLVAALPIWSAQPARPPLPGSSPAEPVGWVWLVIPSLFVVALCLPFRPYVLALRVTSRASISTALLFGLTSLLAAVALLIYPGYGSDIFDYVGFERMWAIYGDNPLLALPINRPDDWATALVWYPDRTPAYGPLWALLTWPLVRLAGDSLALEVLAYKLLALLGYGACCWLIWTIADPSTRQRALISFGWSPLVLFEVLGKVHNDVLPALAMLGSVWLVTHPRHAARTGVLSLAAIAAGGLVKATALAAALPVAAWLFSRAGRRPALLAVILGLLLTVGLYAPFWVGLATLAPLANQAGRVVWSPASLVLALTETVPGGPYDPAVRAGLGGLWVIACARVLWRIRLRQSADLATASVWLLLATLLLLTGAFFAHYLVPAVALVAIANRPGLERLVRWLCIGGLAAYSVELFSLIFGPDWVGSSAYRICGTLVLILPAAIAALFELMNPGGDPVG